MFFWLFDFLNPSGFFGQIYINLGKDGRSKSPLHRIINPFVKQVNKKYRIVSMAVMQIVR